MSTFNSHTVAASTLRISLGIMYLAHSIVLKYFTFTLAGTAQYFQSIGLPSFTAYLVFAAEAIGGILLVLGIQTRLTALALIPVLLGATWVHAANGWVFNANGGGWEYPVFLVIVSVVTALLAPTSSKSTIARNANVVRA